MLDGLIPSLKILPEVWGSNPGKYKAKIQGWHHGIESRQKWVRRTMRTDTDQGTSLGEYRTGYRQSQTECLQHWQTVSGCPNTILTTVIRVGNIRPISNTGIFDIEQTNTGIPVFNTDIYVSIENEYCVPATLCSGLTTFMSAAKLTTT